MNRFHTCGPGKNDSPLKKENVPSLSTARPRSKVRRDRKIRGGQYLEQDRYSETFPKSEDTEGRKQIEDIEVKRWLEREFGLGSGLRALHS